MITTSPTFYAKVVIKGNNAARHFPSTPFVLELLFQAPYSTPTSWDQFTPPFVGGAFYCFLIKDNATGYYIAYRTTGRQILHDICHAIHVLCTNSRREFVNKKAVEYYDLLLPTGAYGSI
jgi:hypothetical protein